MVGPERKGGLGTKSQRATTNPVPQFSSTDNPGSEHTTTEFGSSMTASEAESESEHSDHDGPPKLGDKASLTSRPHIQDTSNVATPRLNRQQSLIDPGYTGDDDRATLSRARQPNRTPVTQQRIPQPNFNSNPHAQTLVPGTPSQNQEQRTPITHLRIPQPNQNSGSADTVPGTSTKKKGDSKARKVIKGLKPTNLYKKFKDKKDPPSGGSGSANIDCPPSTGKLQKRTCQDGRTYAQVVKDGPSGANKGARHTLKTKSGVYSQVTKNHLQIKVKKTAKQAMKALKAPIRTTVPANRKVKQGKKSITPAKKATVPARKTTIQVQKTKTPANKTTTPSKTVTKPAKNATKQSNKNTEPLKKAVMQPKKILASTHKKKHSTPSTLTPSAKKEPTSLLPVRTTKRGKA
jgi:hypothetical protein